MCEGGEEQTNERRETLFVWTNPSTGASEVKTTFSAKCTTNGLLRMDCAVCELESKAAREATHRCRPGLGSSTVDQVLKYTKYLKHIPSTSTGQVLRFKKST